MNRNWSQYLIGGLAFERAQIWCKVCCAADTEGDHEDEYVLKIQKYDDLDSVYLWIGNHEKEAHDD